MECFGYQANIWNGGALSLPLLVHAFIVASFDIVDLNCVDTFHAQPPSCSVACGGSISSSSSTNSLKGLGLDTLGGLGGVVVVQGVDEG